MTPHNSAKIGDIAKIVVLPGDPIRARKMARKFLKDVRIVNRVRNNFCYTGKYKDTKVSIMSTGMGPASMGIYSYELFKFYNVKYAIRLGTTGSLDKNLVIGDIIVARSCMTDTNFNEIYSKKGETEIKCSRRLLSLAREVAKDKKIKINICSLYTTDTFYSTKVRTEHIRSLGAKGVEMEGASLYDNANKLKADALCICTVSDEVLTGKTSTSEERENNYSKMFNLALEMATRL